MKEKTCKNCGKILNQQTPCTDGTMPRKGDVSICFYCGDLDLFGANGSLQGIPSNQVLARMTREELDDIEKALHALYHRKGFSV